MASFKENISSDNKPPRLKMSDTDKRNKFAEAVFSYRESKAKKVFIYWQGKQVMILKDKKAEKFLAQIAGLNDREAQLVMAKITGNFKRGNERPKKI